MGISGFFKLFIKTFVYVRDEKYIRNKVKNILNLKITCAFCRYNVAKAEDRRIIKNYHHEMKP